MPQNLLLPNPPGQNLMLHTSVKFVGKSQLLEIDVELPDPALAAAVANALAQGFIDSQRASNLAKGCLIRRVGK